MTNEIEWLIINDVRLCPLNYDVQYSCSNNFQKKIRESHNRTNICVVEK